MIDIILLAIFSYALYRLAESYNITPWKWIFKYIGAFFGSYLALSIGIVAFYGQSIVKDIPALEKMALMIEPFVLLYQFLLFFFFRTRIIRYVHILDQIDKNDNNNFPDPPAPTKDSSKDQKDFSYFR
jgi:hypothetical protein